MSSPYRLTVRGLGAVAGQTIFLLVMDLCLRATQWYSPVPWRKREREAQYARTRRTVRPPGCHARVRCSLVDCNPSRSTEIAARAIDLFYCLSDTQTTSVERIPTLPD